MACTLLLMRHSYAAAEDGMRDFDRPLTGAGVELAERTGLLLKKLGATPDLMITSSAARTVATGRCIAEQFPGDTPQVARDELYQARSSAYLPTVQSAATPETPTVLAIGHNPGIGTLMNQLADGRFPVPPATVGIYSIDADDWSDLPALNDRNATLTHLIIEGTLEPNP